MKNTVCCRKKFVSIGIIFFLMLFITACSPGNGPTGTSTPPLIVNGEWETLTSLSAYPAFSDFTPIGQSVLYTGYGSSFQEFAFPTTGNPLGVFTTLTALTDGINTYQGFAWVGGNLFMAQGNSVYVYNIAGNSWTTPVTTLTYSHSESESTADDSGYIYSLSGSQQLLKFNTSNNTPEYIATPVDLGTDEPRAAWDSATQRVYLANYDDTPFYAFNPADNSFTSLAPFPDSAGMSDAFCSDRHGHIFTANSDYQTTKDVWVYTAATNTWMKITPLPFAHGSSAACTVSADGWLYFGDGDQLNFARVKVF